MAKIPVPRGSDIKERLSARSDPQADGCIHYVGLTIDGYGRILHQKRNRMAHRVAYEVFVGPIPNDLCVLHRCDDRRCINVDHLFLGTRADNNADKVSKNRQSRNTGTPGERRPLAKLRDEDIPKIRADHRPQKYIANAYGVTQAVISRIKTGLSWSHIQGP